ncbi:hypothetical protein CRYUN_Cryun14cG0042800 [Craigia yunnanensis]
MFPELRSSQSCARSVLGSEPVCPPECNQNKGIDVFYKVVRQVGDFSELANTWSEFVQEGIARLWRGTNASLALAVPTVGIYLPYCDSFCNSMEEFTTNNAPILTLYVPLVAGIVARSLACVTCYPVEPARTRMQTFKETQSGVKPPRVWKTLYRATASCGLALVHNLLVTFLSLQPVGQHLSRRKLLVLMGDEAGTGSIIGANFTAGFVAGSIAAAVTCPLDVAKTGRQIEVSTF